MVQLKGAALCMNCEMISQAKTDTCEACGANANWLRLTSVLGNCEQSAVLVEPMQKGAAA